MVSLKISLTKIKKDKLAISHKMIASNTLGTVDDRQFHPALELDQMFTRELNLL